MNYDAPRPACCVIVEIVYPNIRILKNNIRYNIIIISYEGRRGN